MTDHDFYYTPSTYIVDRDTATTILDAAELTAARVRPVIDAIAARLEAALAEAGEDHVIVAREYRVTGRRGTADIDPRLVERVLVGQADAIRDEVIGRRCGCGAWTGERCGLVRPLADLVCVEVIPEYLRASHEAAGGRGSYPHNGADRALVAPACADDLLAEHGEWARIAD